MPEPRTLLLLRHGRTAYNAAKRIQGQRDVPLDATGESQAARAAAVLAAMEPAFVRTSDLARARVTAEQVAGAAGLPVLADARLREFDLGERTGWTHDQYAEACPEEFARFRAGEYDVAPGSETVSTLVGRTLPALDEALAQVPAGGLGIVVSHGAALRVSVAEWVGLPRGSAMAFGALGNCHWALVQDAPAGGGAPAPQRLVAWNRHA
ncbi:histidine phosphatase family protein [Nocardioides campestrisoli]|uniref:histidine phosphatase family protein n=1 Tax=Nocardioides campestrisoli TaxID=2736757 RepID=UPI0015E74F34|nr:histidine phosphatase family protein [Nocardioides campestrisoli]